MSEPMHFDLPDGELPFTIGTQSFVAKGLIAAEDFPDFIDIVTRLGESADTKPEGSEGSEGDPADEETGDLIRRQIGVVKEALTFALPGDEIQRVLAGMASGAERPIPFPVVVKVLNWLMKEYGMSERDDEADTAGAGAVRPLEPLSD